MFHFDSKFIIVGVLFVALVLAKLLSGGRPYNRPVRRQRRFGFRGSMSPLNEPGARERPPAPEPPPRDPEEEFFKKS
ncbi:MAG: hypothetical protein HY901_22175 [Deltaproteobacteria bacterium]|nr:hypothetical protein [Deltaproteobacteria bacterium]